MYCTVNFKTKAALKRAVKAHRAFGVFSHAPFAPIPRDGKVVVHGPYGLPRCLRSKAWTAVVTLHDNYIVGVE